MQIIRQISIHNESSNFCSLDPTDVQLLSSSSVYVWHFCHHLTVDPHSLWAAQDGGPTMESGICGALTPSFLTPPPAPNLAPTMIHSLHSSLHDLFREICYLSIYLSIYTQGPFCYQSPCSGWSFSLESSSLCSKQWFLAPHSGLTGIITLIAAPLDKHNTCHTHTWNYLSSPKFCFIFFIPLITIRIFLFVYRYRCIKKQRYIDISPLEHKFDESRNVILFTTTVPILRTALVDYRCSNAFAE